MFETACSKKEDSEDDLSPVAGSIVEVTQAARSVSDPLLKTSLLIGRPMAVKALWNQVRAGSTQLLYGTCSGPPVVLNASGSNITVALGVWRFASLGGVK